MDSAASEFPRVEVGQKVFISHAADDADWALRLSEDLGARGLELARADFTEARIPEGWGKSIGPMLMASQALVVLWTPKTKDAPNALYEIGYFESVSEHKNDYLPLIPVFFGEDARSTAPPNLRGRVGVDLSSELYANGPEAGSQEWMRAVREIARLVAHSESGTSDREASTSIGSESPQKGLRQAQVVQAGKRPGWLLGEDLAVVRAAGEMPRDELSASTEFGITGSVAIDWPEPHHHALDNFSLIRLGPRLKLSPPLPVGPATPGILVELWGSPLTHVQASAEVGDRNEDGSFHLRIRSEGRTVENGAAVWDRTEGRFLGISIFGRDRHCRLYTVATLRELAGKSPYPDPLSAAAPPSARIHDDSWTIEDRLDYALYARAIKEFIQHPDTKPPLVIGVQGPWGQGKTSLMRIAQNRLDPEHPDLGNLHGQTSPPKGPSAVTFRDLRDSLDGDISLDRAPPGEIRSVWFNPWKYQSSESLWAGLAHSILTQLPARLPRHEQELFWLKLQLRRIDPTAVRRDIHRLVLERLLPWLVVAFALLVFVAAACALLGANTAVAALAGLSTGTVVAIAAGANAQRKVLAQGLEGSYLRYVSEPDYAGKLGYFHHVEEDMRRALALLAPADEPTVVFIDDLDRCSAAKIGEVLEAINLFLSGEYPNCIFVLGIDAQVVASAMETVHRQALGDDEGENDDLKGNLGWRFLDKFIQLSFVMPRLSTKQREAYLTSLLGVDEGSDTGDAGAQAVVDAKDIRSELAAGALRAEDAARRVGELTGDPASSQSDDVRQVAEEVIALGAADFSDSDPETVAALRSRLPHLSDNPRTIKRAVNLYRFYRFIAWAREASAPDLSTADPELIASWTVIAARWPQVVHWLQLNGRDDDDPGALVQATWDKDEPELCAYLRNERDLDLAWAMACGLW